MRRYSSDGPEDVVVAAAEEAKAEAEAEAEGLPPHRALDAKEAEVAERCRVVLIIMEKSPAIAEVSSSEETLAAREQLICQSLGSADAAPTVAAVAAARADRNAGAPMHWGGWRAGGRGATAAVAAESSANMLRNGLLLTFPTPPPMGDAPALRGGE